MPVHLFVSWISFGLAAIGYKAISKAYAQFAFMWVMWKKKKRKTK